MTKARTLENPPVIEAVAEIRFESTLPSAVLFGKMYESLGNEYSDVETMPILEMPEQLIKQQPDLKYAVHYRLKNTEHIISIGSNVLGISRICNNTPYKTWDDYLLVIKQVIDCLKNARIVSHVTRSSVKYINFYPGENKLEARLKLGLQFDAIANSYDELTANFTTTLPDDAKLVVAVGTRAQVTNPPFDKEKGILFILEAFEEKDMALEDAISKFELLHQHVEDAFFNTRVEN